MKKILEAETKNQDLLHKDVGESDGAKSSR